MRSLDQTDLLLIKRKDVIVVVSYLYRRCSLCLAWNLEHTIATSEADIKPIIRTATTPITLHIIAAECEAVSS